MNHWLLKTEPEVYSIDDLKKDKTTLWDCVRNYQARNYLRAMEVGDLVFIYHSNSEPSGIAGLATVIGVATAEESQFDKKSDYFDPKATRENPRWFAPKIKFKNKFKNMIALKDLKNEKSLKDMPLLQKGSRLSVQLVKEEEFNFIIDKFNC
jgi:predicted RNA-binding protein with PUA-like domain